MKLIEKIFDFIIMMVLTGVLFFPIYFTCEAFFIEHKLSTVIVLLTIIIIVYMIIKDENFMESEN